MRYYEVMKMQSMQSDSSKRLKENLMSWSVDHPTANCDYGRPNLALAICFMK